MGCDEGPQFDNPLDPDNNPDYVAPETNIITDIDGMTFDTSYVQIVISGNELVSEYSYTLDSLVWSDWSADDTLDLNYLDEGEYTLYVKSRYLSGEEDIEPASASFTIDAVDGPGLRIYPIYSKFDAGVTVQSVQLYLETVENVSFGVIVLNLKSNASCNSNFIASKGSLLTTNNGETVLIDEEFEENILGDVFASYKITFGISQDGGIGLSGTGSVADLQISDCGHPIEIQFDLENSKILDYDNNEIPLIDSGVGIVE